MTEPDAEPHDGGSGVARVAGELLATFAVTVATAAVASVGYLALAALYADRYDADFGGEFAVFSLGERSFVLTLLLFAPPVGFQLIRPISRRAAGIVDRIVSGLLPLTFGCAIVMNDPTVITKSIPGGHASSAWVLLAPVVLLIVATPLCAARRRSPG